MADLFNASWYLSQNPDIKAAVEAGLISAREHFELHGKTEGRSPGPLFDPQHYLNQNPDIKAAVEAGLLNAYDHFVNYGMHESRSPMSLFNVEFYLQQNPDVKAAVEGGLISAVEHFLSFGQNEARYIDPFINLGAYLNANPDVKGAVGDGMSALEHLMLYGVSEGRDLGNGINLSIFTNDPAFKDALASSDIAGAMARVEEVAPFLPTFEPAPNWEAPANTPIPMDFTPPEGTKLVVPDSVVVPDGTELPDTFEPLEPAPTPEPGGGGGDDDATDNVTTTIGALSPTATDNDGYMYAGNGNSNENFSISTTDLSKLELALKGYMRGKGDVDPSGTNGIIDFPTYSFNATDRAGFAYSLASLSSKSSLQEKIDEGYSFHLKIDIDGSEETDFVTLELEAASSSESGYQWVQTDDPTVIISDDDGTDFVTQNIQSPIWYGHGLEIGNSGVLKGGEYTISLEAFKDNSQLFEQSITLDVNDLDIAYGSTLSDFALTAPGGNMLDGKGNPGTDFAVHRIGLDGDGDEYLEIALGGQQRSIGPVYKVSEEGIIEVPSGEVPVFKFSVGTNSDDRSLVDLLEDYDIRLLVDTDASEGTNFIELIADAPESNLSETLDWKFAAPNSNNTNDASYQETYRLTDDSGDAQVSQNIQALSWYQPKWNETEDENELFATTDWFDSEGYYTVSLLVYEKNSVQLIGATEVVFHTQEVTPT